MRPRKSFSATTQKEFPPHTDANSVPSSVRENSREPSAASVFAREEYQSAIRSLGSAKTRLQGPSHPQFSSTPAVSSNSTSALVPEEEYVADDWMEDDLQEIQPKKKRRIRLDQNGIRGEDILSSSAASQNRSINLDVAPRGNHAFICALYYAKLPTSLCNYSLCTAGPSSSSRGLSVRKNSSVKPHQIKMTQIPGMVRLGRREVSRPQGPSLTVVDEMILNTTPPQIHTQVRNKMFEITPSDTCNFQFALVLIHQGLRLIPVVKEDLP